MMKSTLHKCVVNAIPVANPTRMSKSDKYMVTSKITRSNIKICLSGIENYHPILAIAYLDSATVAVCSRMQAAFDKAKLQDSV